MFVKNAAYKIFERDGVGLTVVCMIHTVYVPLSSENYLLLSPRNRDVITPLPVCGLQS